MLRLGPEELAPAPERADGARLAAFIDDFALCAPAHQLPPPTAREGAPWTTWLLLGGRGAGKTFAGAQWVKGIALGRAPYADEPIARIALVGETEHDVREVMIEGVSGVLACMRAPSARAGAVAAPARMEQRRRRRGLLRRRSRSLRGPQFGAAWADELAKWRHADATFDMLQFGLRLGERPRQVITTTPRPIGLIRRLIADRAHVALTRVATQANAAFLSPVFIDTVIARYVGTQLGRQEIDGELIDERPDALWSRARIEACRVIAAPPLARIVVAVDPPAASTRQAAACGLVAAGCSEDGMIYVLADDTVAGLSPAGSAAKAIALWRRLRADALVAEVNQGGDMVRTVIAQADPTVPVTPVRATRGKWLRAEPVAALYEQGKVKHTAPSRRWRTRCVTSAWTACPPAARPTASTRWCGRSPR